MRCAFAGVILMLAAGCSHSSVATTQDDPVQDALESVKECLRDAIDSVRAITAPPPKDDESEDPPSPLPATVGALVKAAQDLVAAAAGNPMEPDAKAILATAQELVPKSNDPSSARECEQGLQQLLSKVNELRKRH